MENTVRLGEHATPKVRSTPAEERLRVSRRLLLQTAGAGFALSAAPRPAPATPVAEPAARFFDPTYDFTLEYDWLMMPDGVHLAVDYYRPIGQDPDEQFPVVLEVLP